MYMAQKLMQLFIVKFQNHNKSLYTFNSSAVWFVHIQNSLNVKKCSCGRIVVFNDCDPGFILKSCTKNYFWTVQYYVQTSFN